MRGVVCLVLAAVIGSASVCSAAAQGAPPVYIFDVLRRSNYPTAYNRLFKGERGAAAWFGTAKAAERSTTSAGRVISLGGRNEELYTFCKPHDCFGNAVGVLFSDYGDRAVAISKVGNELRVYGNPDLAEQIALKQSVADM